MAKLTPEQIAANLLRAAEINAKEGKPGNAKELVQDARSVLSQTDRKHQQN